MRIRLLLCGLILAGWTAGVSAQTVSADRFRFNTGACYMISGSGSPEGVTAAPICYYYLRTDTGDIYTKQSGTGTVGWTLVPRLAGTNTWTGTQTFGNVAVTGTATLTGSAITGDLTPTLSDTYNIGNPFKLWNQAYISQMNAVLFAKETQTLYGGWLSVSKNAGTFATSVASTDTSVDFGTLMVPNQFVLVRAAENAGGIITAEFMKVGTLVSGTRYNVTRNLSGLGAKNWASGTPFMVRGVAGDGWLELNAFDTPRLSIFTQGSLYNNSVENVRIGHLAGMPNSATGIGAYMGDANNFLYWNGANFKVQSAGVTLDDTGLFISPRSAAGGGTFANTNALRWTTDPTYRTALWRSDATTQPVTRLRMDNLAQSPTSGRIDIVTKSINGTQFGGAWLNTAGDSGSDGRLQLVAGGDVDSSRVGLWMNASRTGTGQRAFLGYGTWLEVSDTGGLGPTDSPGITSGVSITTTGVDLKGAMTLSGASGLADTAYATGNFTAGGGGTWTVDSGDQETYRSLQIDKLMHVQVSLVNTSITGTVTSVTIKIPNSKLAARRYETTCLYINGSGSFIQTNVEISSGGSTMTVYPSITQSGAFAASTNATQLFLDLWIEVQ